MLQYIICARLSLINAVSVKVKRVWKLEKLRGKRLKPDACIGIIALATGVGEQDYTQGLDALQKMGYRYKMSPTLKSNEGYFSGTDEFRAQELMKFFLDDEVDAILCYGGGYGSARILPYLDFAVIRKHPKLFIGYSDITALLVSFYQKAGLITVHGPMLKSFTRRYTEYTEKQFAKGLQGKIKGKFNLPGHYALQTLCKGKATAPIIGGNLAILASLCGTEYQLQAAGKILFIEEVGEEAYAIDRMLNQLEQAGTVKDIRGLIWGKFAKCGPNKVQPYEYTVNQVIEAYSRRWNVPTVANLPVGHLPHNGFLPMGVTVDLEAGQEAKINILDEYVK